MFPLVWEAIRNIECGLKVVVVTVDGASPNHKLFKMHQGSKKSGEIVYKTPNPYSLESHDIFMSDVPYLIKTTLNCWSNSGHTNTRALWAIISIVYCPNIISCCHTCRRMDVISWTHLMDLYGKANSASGLTLLPNIKKAHTFEFIFTDKCQLSNSSSKIMHKFML